ncbi:MAG: DUF2309 domain-containing protein [Planctomycetota bacterium]
MSDNQIHDPKVFVGDNAIHDASSWCDGVALTTRSQEVDGRFDRSLSSQPNGAEVRRSMDDLLTDVAAKVSPVWPLKDYVAVTPYAGIANRKFLSARSFLQIFSDCETLMPMAYYADRYRSGDILDSHICLAIEEFRQEGLLEHLPMDLGSVLSEIRSIDLSLDANESAIQSTSQPAPRPIRTMAELLAGTHGIDWSEFVTDEIGKHCAAHYDGGQAMWTSGWKSSSLYQAWREVAAIDRNPHCIGLTGFHRFVASLPSAADAAIEHLLDRLDVPPHLWTSVLLCQAYSVLGWSSWAKYQSEWSGDATRATDFAGIIAMRLAYDVALSETFDVNLLWEGISLGDAASFDAPVDSECMVRFVMLRASEIALRSEILESLETPLGSDTTIGEARATARKQVQMVFCIDVRSERIRRHLESDWPELETFGFAGFFGMPIRFSAMDDQVGTASLPVLLQPTIEVQEGLRGHGHGGAEEEVIRERRRLRSWRKTWKWLQSSVVGCFPFVESTGPWFGWKLLARSVRWKGLTSVGAERFDGVKCSSHSHLGPTEQAFVESNWALQDQVNTAEGMLRNLGLVDSFARMVVVCGHASQTDNNPLAAGLDCGACGGHSGEPNARFAAMLLNRPSVREQLANRGIEIPHDTIFVAGLHNTTTDEITLFDEDMIPKSHEEDVARLRQRSQLASIRTRAERAPLVGDQHQDQLFRRALDWSELQPEWGLAGNAAFIVAPRSITRDANLDGRSFLHSYDFRDDPTGEVLETIMTAPMVVAHWINMQYYASTVDNRYFGSGSKTVHNVVGNFGILSGSGGDLQTGLPLQSLQSQGEFQYAPTRLQSVISAPRSTIDGIVAKHELLQNLFGGGWMHLIAIDDGCRYRYRSDGTWTRLPPVSANQASQMADQHVSVSAGVAEPSRP